MQIPSMPIPAEANVPGQADVPGSDSAAETPGAFADMLMSGLAGEPSAEGEPDLTEETIESSEREEELPVEPALPQTSEIAGDTSDIATGSAALVRADGTSAVQPGGAAPESPASPSSAGTSPAAALLAASDAGSQTIEAKSLTLAESIDRSPQQQVNGAKLAEIVTVSAKIQTVTASESPTESDQQHLQGSALADGGSDPNLGADLTRGTGLSQASEGARNIVLTTPASQLSAAGMRQIAEMLQTRPDAPVEITLNPEELGRVRIALTQGEGGLSVSILADEEQTLELFRRHSDELQQQLSDLGFETTHFDFGQSGHQSGGDSLDPLPPEDHSQTAPALLVDLDLLPRDSLDIRL